MNAVGAAEVLRRLRIKPDLLILVDVGDSHSYPDGQRIPGIVRARRRCPYRGRSRGPGDGDLECGHGAVLNGRHDG